MPNIMKLMKEAASMQQKLAELQKELATRTVEFSSGGGMVKVTASGDGLVTRISIDPKVVDSSDVEMLEDTILAGVQGAIQAARQMAAAEMGKLTSGLGLPPGLGIPGF